MTGYGEANQQGDAVTVAVELRAVNNRYLKVTLRAVEPYNLLEPEFEKVIRRVVKRGTVQVHLRFQRQHAPTDFHLNTAALRSYLGQLKQAALDLGLGDPGPAALAAVLALPGVAAEPATASLSLEEDWPLMQRVLEEALARLQ